MKDGVLNINKPAGWTSQDVCAKLRGRLHIRRIGHTGTLDPMATGVLPVCLGKATRIIEYYDNDFKTYHAGMKLGITTDTLDIWGEVLEEKSAAATEEDIRKAFSEYTGKVSQIPPKYSALKINGRRAYDLAREGREFEIRAREIMILSNDITKLDIESGEIEFDVTCSKGTYIRTICDDIGRRLGCGAAMTSLVRTRSGCFDIAGALELSELIAKSDEEIEKLVIPMDETLISLGVVVLNDNRFTAFINGNSSAAGFKVIKEPAAPSEAYRAYSRGRFLGIAAFTGGELVPLKVIRKE